MSRLNYRAFEIKGLKGVRNKTRRKRRKQGACMEMARSAIFNMFPLEGQRCPEKLAGQREEVTAPDRLCDLGGVGSGNSGLSVILSSPALSGCSKDLLFQFCSTAAVERRQKVIFVSARRLVAPPPIAVHRLARGGASFVISLARDRDIRGAGRP